MHRLTLRSIVFESGFAEGTDSASLDLASLPSSSAGTKSFTFNEDELSPFFQVSAGADEYLSPSPTSPQPQEAEHDQPRASKRRREDPQDAAEPGGRIAVIDITETE